MTEPEHLAEREAERRGPSEWQVALAQFRDVYGTTPDLERETDRYLLLQLVRDEVYWTINADMVASIQRRTARIREIGR
jgi:hypothetical protein